jgi:hypothetical protein
MHHHGFRDSSDIYLEPCLLHGKFRTSYMFVFM